LNAGARAGNPARARRRRAEMLKQSHDGNKRELVEGTDKKIDN